MKIPYLLLIGGCILLVLAGVWYFFIRPAVAPPSQPLPISPASKDDLITVLVPLPNTSVQNPIHIEGQARGSWYFEAQFPVKIYDANHQLLGATLAHATSDWMTSNYVPFTATLVFATTTTATGTLVLQKDNPSGLPKNDNALTIPIIFATTTTNFVADGILVRNNPGLTPNVWYLVYEKPGAPALTVALDLNAATGPYLDLIQGAKMHVVGTLQNSVVVVSSISPAENMSNDMPIKLYYYDPKLDQGGIQCSSKGLVAVNRVIPKTQTPLTDTIKLLLRGEVSDEEKAHGITTDFPLTGVSLTNAAIANGIATLTFADPLHKTSGGSCRVAILWAEISTTAKQFQTVTSVQFKPTTLFQP